MQEPENIVANRTHRLSNRRCESSEDKVLAFERRGHAEVRASNLAVASCQALRSIVRASTRTWFKWIIERDESVSTRRNQNFRTRSGGCVRKQLRCNGNITVARSDGQSREGPWTQKVHGGMRKPTPWVVQGLADVVVVAMTPPIIRRQSEGPLGSGTIHMRHSRNGKQKVLSARNNRPDADQGPELILQHICDYIEGMRSVRITAREGRT